MQPGIHPYLGGLPQPRLGGGGGGPPIGPGPILRGPPGLGIAIPPFLVFFLRETSLLLWTIRRIPLFQHLPYVFRHTCVKQGKSAFQAEYLVYWQSKDHSVGLGGETAGFSNSGHHLPFFLPGDYHHDKVPLLLSGDAEALPHPF